MSPIKLKLFADVILTRISRENRKAEEIIEEYIKLTKEEKQEILNEIA